MRGQYKGKTGKVESVNTQELRILITGIEQPKKDGTKSKYPFKPSNLMIEELDLSDKRRMKRSSKNTEATKKEAPATKEVKPKVEEKKPVAEESKPVKEAPKKEDDQK